MNKIAAAWIFLAVLAGPVFGQQAAGQTGAEQRQAIEQQKIEYLIASVAALHDATFIRNGVGYDAAKAAAHMRLKRRFAGSAASTAEGFIVCCATGSSMSGINYTIRFHDGRVVDSAVFLRRKLAEYVTLAAKGTQGTH
ncbi:MAG TPA: DUF5329 family protein [Rhodanobacter sp.]|nr:DUF5329 family protein [Rhodanobacter sp.]